MRTTVHPSGIVVRKLLPYARKLVAARRRGLVPNGWTAVSLDAWDHGLGAPARLVVPPGEPLETFDFSVLSALSVMLLHSPNVDRERVSLATELIVAETPKRLVVVAVEDGSPTLHRIWPESKR